MELPEVALLSPAAVMKLSPWLPWCSAVLGVLRRLSLLY